MEASLPIELLQYTTFKTHILDPKDVPKASEPRQPPREPRVLVLYLETDERPLCLFCPLPPELEPVRALGPAEEEELRRLRF